jgi:hypothetical protein
MPRAKIGPCSNGAEFHMVRCPRKRAYRGARRNAGVEQPNYVPIIQKGNTGVVNFYRNLKAPSIGKYRKSSVAQPHPMNLSNTSPTNIIKASTIGKPRSSERMATKTIVDEPFTPIETIKLKKAPPPKRSSGPVRTSLINLNIPLPRVEGGVPVAPNGRRSTIYADAEVLPNTPYFMPGEADFGEQGEIMGRKRRGAVSGIYIPNWLKNPYYGPPREARIKKGIRRYSEKGGGTTMHPHRNSR